MSQGTYRIPESVMEDTHAYGQEVARFLAGDLAPVAFRAIRVPMGIYEQRENDTYMIRVRGAGGVFLPQQLERIADLAEAYGSGVVHVTTRQDLQIHRVRIDDTPLILDSLLEAGLSSRGGGGNTVRNVTACPDAGACAREVFDVTPYALALTEYLMANRANFNLPRKFKTAFSGCGDDCALCSVADLGFFAHVREGARGFAVYAGGGLGAAPSLSVLIEEFIPDRAIFEVAEAVKRLFDKHGDRANRHMARLRFVVQRLGAEGFRRLYQAELEAVRQEGVSDFGFRISDFGLPGGRAGTQGPQSAIGNPRLPGTDPKSEIRNPKSEILRLALGDIRAPVLRAVGELAVAYGDGTVRATHDQNLQIRGVPEARLPELHAALREVDAGLVARQSLQCVACAGAATCKLGLCLSRGLAEAVEAELQHVPVAADAPLRISGCPNCCGQHPIAPIGLQGGAMRANGRLVPVYSLFVGGRMVEGDAALGRAIGKVPARAVPSLLEEFWVEAEHNRREGESTQALIERWGADRLRALLPKYQQVPTYEDAPEFYRDFGSDEEFSLAGRGPGECGAGVTDVIALDIDEARRSLEQGSLYEAVVAMARALLVTRGIEPKKDREIFAAFAEHLIAPRWVGPRAQVVLNSAVDYRLGDRDTLDDLAGDIRALLDRVRELFRSLDSNLQFRVPPVEDARVPRPPGEPEASQELDLRGVACPLNFVRAKVQLDQVGSGEVLDILLDDGDPIRNVPASLSEQGQEVLQMDREEGHFRLRVRKRD